MTAQGPISNTLPSPAILAGAPGYMAAQLWTDKNAATTPDLVVLEAPDIDIAIQTRYARAGADILKTMSFSANRLAMPRVDTVSLCHNAVSHCRTAARAAGRKLLIAGCIGQLNQQLATEPAADVALAFATQAKALIDAGADLLIYETIYDTVQAHIALDGIMREAINTPVWLSAVCTSVTAGQLADLASEYGASAAGYNCTPPDGSINVELRRLGQMLPSIPLIAAPSVAPRFATLASDMTRRLSLSVIGGCCGVTPRHISALRRTLNIKSLKNNTINA